MISRKLWQPGTLSVFILIAGLGLAGFLADAAVVIGAQPQANGPDAHSIVAIDSVTNLTKIAGSYSLGDGAGFILHLQLRPDGKFSEKWSGCMGIYGFASGTANIEQGKLILRLTEASGMYCGTRDWPKILVAAHSGSQEYLIRESDVARAATNPVDARWNWYQKCSGPITAPFSLSEQPNKSLLKTRHLDE
jgi:hypothetical protein